METFTWVPSTATQGQMTPRTLTAQFGEGYAQDVKDGINALLRTWDLTFDPLPPVNGIGTDLANLLDINAFLELRGGAEKFLWLQPTPFDLEGLVAFICKSWQFVYNGGDVTSLRCTFMRRPI
jgi:phage-related protein